MLEAKLNGFVQQQSEQPRSRSTDQPERRATQPSALHADDTP
jgi:hypothetical protein